MHNVQVSVFFFCLFWENESAYSMEVYDHSESVKHWAVEHYDLCFTLRSCISPFVRKGTFQQRKIYSWFSWTIDGNFLKSSTYSFLLILCSAVSNKRSQTCILLVLRLQELPTSDISTLLACLLVLNTILTCKWCKHHFLMSYFILIWKAEL